MDVGRFSGSREQVGDVCGGLAGVDGLGDEVLGYSGDGPHQRQQDQADSHGGRDGREPCYHEP
jgi:hypothetical protein